MYKTYLTYMYVKCTERSIIMYPTGLTVEDVVLIDNCSAQHGLLAAEIVLRHWQRIADQDGMIPCNLHNLQGVLGDMGREDLVEMLTN